MINIMVDTRNFEQARRVLETLGVDVLEKAIVDAANRAAKGGAFTGGKRLLKKQYAVKAEDVKDAFRLVPARRGGQQMNPIQALGMFAGRPQPLFNFSPRPQTVMGGKTSGGVSALVSGQRHRFRHSFIAEMGSGHKGVFQRRGQERLPIEELYVLSIPQMVEDQKHGGAISKEIQADMQKRFEERFVDNCNRLLESKGLKKG